MEITQKANANWMICCCAILLFTACSRFRPSDAHVNLTMSFPLTHSCCSWQRGRFSFAETQITRYAPGTQVFFSLVLPDSNPHLICLNAPPRALESKFTIALRAPTAQLAQCTLRTTCPIQWEKSLVTGMPFSPCSPRPLAHARTTWAARRRTQIL